MGRTSVIMLGNTQGHLNMTGEAVRGDGFYGYTDGLQTIAIYVQDFTGRVFIEASIANEPTENDWFPLYFDKKHPHRPYMEFPRQMPPTGQNGDTGVIGFNITGNFVWLRARIDRSYIMPIPITPEEIAHYGNVDKILLNS